MENNQKGATPGSEKKKTDVVKIVLILLLLISLGTGGYFIMSHVEKTEKITAQEQEIKITKNTLADSLKILHQLHLDFERIKLEREALGLENASLDSTIAALNAEVKKWQGKSAVNARKLREAIDKATAERDVQEKAIDVYKHRVDSLYAVRDSLMKDKQGLQDTINVLKTSNTDLAEKVNIASILRAENITVVSINKKGKESLPLKPDLKAKSIDKLKVTFHMADNKVAKKDKKQIMLRVVEPNGAVLFDMSTGGGFFMSDGKEIPYTSKEEVDFDNTHQKVSFIYVKGSPYKPGNYTVEIYGDGSLIGDKKFLVK